MWSGSSLRSRVGGSLPPRQACRIHPGKRLSVAAALAAGVRHVAAKPEPGHSERSPALGLKQRSRELRLPNNAQQRASSDRIVEWNGNGYRGCLQTLLHDLMAPALAHGRESVVFENATDLRAWENSKLTQPEPQPQPGSRRPRGESAGRLRMETPSRRTA